MLNDKEKSREFRDRFSPHLEAWLQCSLWLTKNGRDAAAIVRETLVEAESSWDVSIPRDFCKSWLHAILIKRFLRSTAPRPAPLAPVFGENGDECPDTVKSSTFAQVTARQNAWLTGGSDEDIQYLEAIASLPATCRSVMILSYIEGFTNREIADLAGLQTQVVGTLLDRGRGFMREEMFAHLMNRDAVTTAEEHHRGTGYPFVQRTIKDVPPMQADAGQKRRMS